MISIIQEFWNVLLIALTDAFDGNKLLSFNTTHIGLAIAFQRMLMCSLQKDHDPWKTSKLETKSWESIRKQGQKHTPKFKRGSIETRTPSSNMKSLRPTKEPISSRQTFTTSESWTTPAKSISSSPKTSSKAINSWAFPFRIWKSVLPLRTNKGRDSLRLSPKTGIISYSTQTFSSATAPNSPWYWRTPYHRWAIPLRRWRLPSDSFRFGGRWVWTVSLVSTNTTLIPLSPPSVLYLAVTGWGSCKKSNTQYMFPNKVTINLFQIVQVILLLHPIHLIRILLLHLTIHRIHILLLLHMDHRILILLIHHMVHIIHILQVHTLIPLLMVMDVVVDPAITIVSVKSNKGKTAWRHWVFQ